MPEFEETSSASNPSHNYTPSTDAKPRTRRRSGGFKKEYGSAPKGNMGEVDPVDALKSEKLSGGSDTSAVEVAPQQDSAPKAEKPERKERAPRQKREPREDDTPRGNPEPSEATLASIQVVEGRIAERKAERDARYEERKKARAAEKKDKPAAKKAANKPKVGAKKQPAKKKGLLASILSLFGLGPKEPVKKPGGNRQGGGSKGGRPQGKGGNRSGQNRRGGNRQGGGQGRRGGRGGQNRRRRPQGARSE